MDFSPGSILAALLYTWGLGLSPVLIARRVAKRPLEKFEANGLAFVTCITLALFAMVMRENAGETNARISPAWILVFLVSRWISIRPGKQDVSLETNADKPGPRLSRGEITAKLRQMIADPNTSDEKRVWAEERLSDYEQLSSGSGRKKQQNLASTRSSQQRYTSPIIVRRAALAVAVALTLDLLLMVSGQRLLLREKIVHPGEHYMAGEWGDIGTYSKPIVVCWYWTGRKLTPAAAWYGFGKNEIDECPFLSDPEAKVWTG